MRRFLIALFALLVTTPLRPAVAGEIPQPIGVPYDMDRKLLPVDSALLDWHDAKRDRDVPAKAYFPADGDGPFRVIIFSHGLGGTREGYEYLGRQWASHGYVVVHLQHIGSDDKVWRGKPANDFNNTMGQAANGRNAIDRAHDVQFAIDQLETVNDSDKQLKGKLDLKHIGMSGHSFGGQTTFVAVGQLLGGPMLSKRIGELSDKRITCAIPMSAAVPANKGTLDAAFGAIKVPIFLMTGTDDNSPIGDTKAENRRLPYDHLKSSPAYLLILTAGDHMVFSGRRVDKPTDPAHQKLIRESSTAFWDAYLKADKVAREWLDGAGLDKSSNDVGTIERK